MANNLFTNFILPLIEITFLVAVFGTMIGWLGFRFYKAWQKHLKFFFKYSIFRRKFRDDDVNWIIEIVNQKLDYVDIKMIMLTDGQSQDRTNEMVWIYNKITNEIQKEAKKGGNINYGRPSQRYNQQDKKSAELPKASVREEN